MLACVQAGSPTDTTQLYSTPGITAGLVTGALLVFLTLCGTCCLLGIQGPRSFPDPNEGKKKEM